MTPRAHGAILGSGALVAAFFLGWLLKAPESTTPEAVKTIVAEVKLAGASGPLVDRISALGGAPAPERAEVDVPQASSTPLPDVSRVFREDLAAIEQTPSGPIVWLVDLDQQTGRRAIRPGEVYRDGWRVGVISAQTIELRKDKQMRRIAVFDAPPPIAE